MTFKIICCDGGGIRGLMTALLLQDIVKQFGVVAKADGFAGTSTGAFELANNIPINDLVSIYETKGLGQQYKNTSAYWVISHSVSKHYCGC